MNQHLQLPLPLERPWPVGIRLRFKLDAEMRPRFLYLRGTPALVLSPLEILEDEWRQYVTAFGARYPWDQFGWALPEQLEIIPGQPADPGLQVADQDELSDRIRHRSRLVPDRLL